ncbi:hypothetical protein V1527DRAFT_477488 [Lipomyces starkeyi]
MFCSRKWPLSELFALSFYRKVISLVQTYQQFLAVRILYGIAMGTIQSRSTVFGVLQKGYTFGYPLAVVQPRIDTHNISLKSGSNLV